MTTKTSQRPRRRGATVTAALCALLGALAGCGDPAPPLLETTGARTMRPLVQPYQAPERADDAATSRRLSPERAEEYNKLLDDFATRQAAAFETEDTRAFLPGLERFYLSTGRYLEILGFYRQAYERHGPSHYITPRLAWGYITVGQNARAREFADLALKHRADDPMSHFVDGYLLTRSAKPTLDLVVRVQAAWRRTLDLDPSFQGPIGISAETLRARLIEMDRLVAQLRGAAPPSAPPSADGAPSQTPGEPLPSGAP